MRKQKHRVEALTFFNSVGICRHLEKMAKKGWMIQKINNMGWYYRRIEPQSLHFTVSYYPQASEYDPFPSEEQQTFHDFCAHTGWKLACTSAQLQIFYNEQENPIPIHTEPALEIAAIHASVKRSFLPSYLFLLAIAVFWSAIIISSLLGDPIKTLSNPSHIAAFFLCLCIFALCIGELFLYFRWHRKALEAAKGGVMLSPPDTVRLQTAVAIAALVIVIYWGYEQVVHGDNLQRFIFLLMGCYYPILYYLVNTTKDFLKKRRVSRSKNYYLTVTVSFVLSFALMGGITALTFRNNWFSEGEETYQHEGRNWTAYHHDLPLCVEDLTQTDLDQYSKEQTGKTTFLLGNVTYHQQMRLDARDFGQLPELRYTVVRVKAPFLYDLCRGRMYRRQVDEVANGRTYEPVDPEPWGAKEAYRRYSPGCGFDNFYLLCYDQVIVEIRFDWEPTAEQMAVVGRKLGV